MKLPRIQFTIAGLLWATFWLALGFAGLARDISRQYWFWVMFSVPCFVAGVAALFGRIRWGIILAIAAGVLTVLFLMAKPWL